MALPFSKTKLTHTDTQVEGCVSPFFDDLGLLASYSVVVDQLVGFHFVLCSDGPLALKLHPADITSRMARTLKDEHQVDRQIM